jgi:RNA polymerase sigma-70 factor (ECF subfamily)
MNGLDQRSEVMRLALENRARIWGYLMGLAKNPERAEDLFQSTYLVICDKWRSYSPDTNFLAWALRIARYEFLASVDPARRGYVTVEAEVLESAVEAAGTSPESASARREALKSCLKELPDKSRSAVELRYGRGQACNSIATRLGMSMTALYSLLSRVRKALQDCAERRLRLEDA